MNSFLFNKIAMAVLGAIFIVMSISMLSGAIFHPHMPETPGYAIEAKAGGEAAGGQEAAKGPELEPVSPLLAAADIDAGAKVFKKCASCHDATNDGKNKVGPNLWNVINAPLMHMSDFSYSKGLQAYAEGKTWTYEELNAFLHKPKKHIPGTAMGFAGLKKVKDRANLIAWLRAQSDSPAPLPAE